eukprot:gene28623-31792_t
MSTLDRMRDVRAATSILENLHNVQDLVPPALNVQAGSTGAQERVLREAATAPLAAKRP